jgi:hypothetical protein
MLFFSFGHIVFIIIVIGSGQCYKDNAPSFQYLPSRNTNLPPLILSMTLPMLLLIEASLSISSTPCQKSCAEPSPTYKAHNGEKREKRQTQGEAAINFFGFGHIGLCML